MSRFAGAVAAITGGADGIGAAYARALGAHGVHVAVLDVLEDKARETADAVTAAGAKSLAVACDVTDRASLAEAQARVTAELGPVSLLIVNAGVGIGGGYIGASERAVDWLVSVNLMGTINTVRAFCPAMIDGAGARHVAFTASSASLVPLDPPLAAYGASKKAMAGLAEGVRAELAPHGIGVTVIYPGLVNTRIWDAARARPEKFGGPRHQPEEAGEHWRREGMTVDHVAARAIAAIEANEPHCVVPDARTRPRFEEMVTAIEAGFPDGAHAAKSGAHACPAVRLRRATPADRPVLEHWDTLSHVQYATGEDDSYDWATELPREVDWREILIAEEDGRPVGVVVIIDAAREETHYWGDVPPGEMAIDIWLGEVRDLGRGLGTQIMRQALDRCYADARVAAVLVDPLASNVRAIRFYERMGFEVVERRRFGSDDCFVMRHTRA